MIEPRGRKRPRTASSDSDSGNEHYDTAPCTTPDAGSSSSFVDALSAPPLPTSPTLSGGDPLSSLPRRRHPRLRPTSLADLPLDILERIGELLLPVVAPVNAHGERTGSRSWVGPATDVVSLSSTCRAAWVAARPLVDRVFGADGLTKGMAYSDEQLHARLEAIALDDDELRTSPSTPASRIRHCYVVLPMHMQDAWYYRRDHKSRLTGQLFVDKLAGMTRLESLAIVYGREEHVTLRSPYQVATLPAEVLIAFTKHPTLRELYLCGIELTAWLSAGAVLREAPKLPPQLRTLTLNTCHDSALLLVTLAPFATQVRVHRDFAAAPDVEVDGFWDQDVWRRVEEVEIVGMSGTQGRPLLDHWRSELELLRTITPAPFIPLRSLRLCEPYSLSYVRSTLLPAIAHLPQLRSFTIYVWDSRSFGAALLGEIHDALPELEELGIAVDSAALTWWRGTLKSYAAQLSRFEHLRTFTWNYSPYADLDFAAVKHFTLPLATRKLLPSLPSLRALRWFGHETHLRPLDDSSDDDDAREWAWSDDPAVRPVTLEWMRRALEVPAPARRRGAHDLSSSAGSTDAPEDLARLVFDDGDSDSDESSDCAFLPSTYHHGRGAAVSAASAAIAANLRAGKRGAKKKRRGSVRELLVAAQAEGDGAGSVRGGDKGKGQGRGKGKGKGKKRVRFVLMWSEDERGRWRTGEEAW